MKFDGIMKKTLKRIWQRKIFIKLPKVTEKISFLSCLESIYRIGKSKSNHGLSITGYIFTVLKIHKKPGVYIQNC